MMSVAVAVAVAGSRELRPRTRELHWRSLTRGCGS